ncbi:hypothetical protein N9J36_02825 [Litoricola sp.]|nr:hypothetical protein [Litorivicinus sp.]
MKFLNILFLAADTARSKGYGQALLKNNLFLKNSVLITDVNSRPGAPQNNVIPDERLYDNILVPDLQVSLRSTLEELSENLIENDSGSINDDSIHSIIKNTHPDLVIYSGFGGEIVRTSTLDLGPKFLHLHSGDLPDYKGSTTIYYSILNREQCCVTAILLSAGIDEGEIILKRYFDRPTKKMDIDYLYDVSIRSQVLVDALKLWAENARFVNTTLQNRQDGEVYYVIHPILKHLAIMSLEE